MKAFSRLLVSWVALSLLACGLSSAQAGNQDQSAELTNRDGTVSRSVMVHEPALTLMQPIVGEPYSAEQESERSQTLADGTHIDQKRELAKMYRDSQGRSRTERILSGVILNSATGPASIVVHIYDPVEGYSYTLDAQKHIAHRFPASVPESAGANGLRTPGRTSVRNPVEWATPLPSGSKVRQARRVKQEALGTEMIEGVQAEGTRVTITTPKGAEGNDRPLVRVCERWHSAELNLTLLSNCSDPRSGRVTMRVRNLDRGEPDPTLFQVPPDYTIVDEKDRLPIGFAEILAGTVSVLP
jgi:hypothetical protein